MSNKIGDGLVFKISGRFLLSKYIMIDEEIDGWFLGGNGRRIKSLAYNASS